MLLRLLAGLLRLAERRFMTIFFQKPPQLTGLEPVALYCAQIGSFSG